jgi:formylglycine-generating enzyme required for sulfatase activity/serine/threonine protein kinase/WD40 repeat protein
MPPDLAQFVENLTQSGLLSAEEVASFQETLSAAERPTDAQGLARQLVKKGRLTKYQATAVYQGRVKTLVFGEYVVLDKLGAGGMGEVLKARHRRMDRIVALKILPTQKVDSSQAIQRFQHEVKAAARLSHPNIVTAYDASECQGIHYLVMEYVDGQDLASLVKQHGPLSVPLAVECILQAAKGLDYAHKHGVIHRDIKPGNLLLDRDGTLKILDMGLAHITESTGPDDATGSERLTSSGQVMGTCDYMAPEQAVDTRTADHRSDLYSLGCTLYRLLVGKPPYTGETMVQVLLAHREKPIPSLREAREDVPEELDAILQKMLAKRPEDRCQSAGELIGPLETLRARLQSESSTPSDQAGDLALRSFLVSLGEQRKGASATVATQTQKKAPGSTQEDTQTYHAEIESVRDLLPAGLSESRQGPQQSLGAHRSAPSMRLLVWLAASGSVVALLVAALIWGLLSKPKPQTDKAVGRAKSQEQAATPPPAVAPFDAQEARKHQEAWAKCLDMPVETTNSIGMKLVLIPPGEFEMGSTQEEVEQLVAEARQQNLSQVFIDKILSEVPKHHVRITRPFHLGRCEVTQAEYKRVMSSNPSRFKDDPNRPVEMVSWDEAVEFCRRLSEQPEEKAAEAVYRLPTEAEWEYACRAGTTTRYSFGDDAALLGQHGWWRANSQECPHSVGRLRPSDWGLYDMHGNVWEWCADWYGTGYYANSAIDAPPGSSSGMSRLQRGGSWMEPIPVCFRCACRFRHPPDHRSGEIGFRVACDIPKAERGKPQGAVPALGKPLERSKPVTLSLAPEPLAIKPGEPLSKSTLVTNPARIPGVLSWTIETVGHRAGVDAVAYSPDGRCLASGSRDGMIRIWDRERLIRVLVGHDSPVGSLSWSPDGTMLAASSVSGEILIWDAASARVLHRRKGDYAQCLSWSPDGQVLAFGVSGSEVRLWDLRESREPVVLQGTEKLPSPTSAAGQTIAWSHDGQKLAVGLPNGRVGIWDSQTSKLVRQLTVDGCSQIPGAVAWSPDDTLVACAYTYSGADAPVVVWDAQSGSLKNRLAGDPDGSRSVAWSSDGRRLAVGSYRGSNTTVAVRAWAIPEGKVLWQLEKPWGGHAIAYDSRQEIFVLGTAIGRVLFLDGGSGRMIGSLPGHGHTVTSAAFSPDGKRLVWSHPQEATSIRVYAMKSDELERCLVADRIGTFQQASWSPDGRVLAMADREGLFLWELPTGKPLNVLPAANAGMGIGFSADSSKLAVSGWNLGRIYEVATGKELLKIGERTVSVAFSPDQRWLAASSGTGVNLYDPRNGTVGRKLAGSPAVALAWSRDGAMLAAVGFDYRLWAWNTANWTLAAEGPPDPTAKAMRATARWLADGSLMVIGDSRWVVTWDPRSGKVLRRNDDPQSMPALAGITDDIVAMPKAAFVRLSSLASGRHLRTIVSLRDQQYVTLSPDGHYHGSPGVEKEFVYVVQTDAGQETLTPEEFSKKYGWKNDPSKAKAGDPKAKRG